MRRSHRLFLGGVVGALGALLTTSVYAQQVRTGSDPRSGVTVNYSALPTGEATQSANRPVNLFSGLSLNNLALTRPTTEEDSSNSSTSRPERRGSIQFDMAPGSALTPYVGIGFGGAAGRVADSARLGAGYSNDNGSDGVRSYQGLAGFAYTFEKGKKIDFGYRFGTTQRPNGGLADNMDIAGAERDQAAVLSFRYDLDPLK
jgi:opacity protein-like surface antigen